jgi:hypothetical protein
MPELTWSFLLTVVVVVVAIVVIIRALRTQLRR